MEALEILGINIKVIFIQIVGFLILYWVLNKLLFSKIKDIITKRKEEIVATYKKNETDRQNIEQLKEEYGRKLGEIRVEAERIINEGRAIGENVKKEILDRAGEEAGQLLNQAREQIEREKERAFIEMEERVAEMVITLASKVIQKTLSQEEHLRLIKEHLSKMESYYGEG